MELFTQALTIMAVGMALVFAFLAVVIWGISLSAGVIRRYEAGQPAAPETAPDADPGPLVAAIAVAIAEHQPTP